MSSADVQNKFDIFNNKILNNHFIESEINIKNTNQAINSNINKKFNKLSNKIKPESVLFTMIKILVEHRNQVKIIDSVLTINAEDLDLVQKLNYCMEVLAHIPFSFQYDKRQTKILLDFFHLEDEMNLLKNLEI